MNFKDKNKPPFVIAEMSGNHNQSLEKALEIVDAVYKSGADALKIQTYTPDTMTIDVRKDDFFIDDPNSLWHGSYLYDLYKQAYTPWEWHKPIFDKARSLGMFAFSTPFDITAVDFLEDLNVPLYKISSFENTDHVLLKKVAQTKKPIILSVGMATITEISESVEVLRGNGCSDLTILKCTSAYPADPSDSNLHSIPYLKNLFHCDVGISDHTMGIGTSIAAVALGATVIEKHFKLSNMNDGVDSEFSLDENEFKILVNESKKALMSLGEVRFGASSNEQSSKKFKRSLFMNFQNS